MLRALMFTILLELSQAEAGGFGSFCYDGIDLPVFKDTSNVTVIWAQAPLFSTNPMIGNTTKRLNLYHSCIIFRQNVSTPSGMVSKFWTLEYDFGTTNGMFDAIIPRFDKGMAFNSPARWCLREGIYHGRDHWKKNFVDVASISPDTFTHIIRDYIPQFNSSDPSAWPQYQIFQVKDVFGKVIIDDNTCTDSFRVIQYIRDDLKLPVKKMVFKATRIKMKVLDMVGERTFAHNKHSLLIEAFYLAMRRAIDKKLALVEKFIAFFQFFLPEFFLHDNNRRQYFSALPLLPEAALVLEGHYEEIGYVASQPPKPEPTCGFSLKCYQRIKQVCSIGGGLACNICVDVWYAKFWLLDGCPLLSTLLNAQACFCGETMSLQSDQQSGANITIV